MSDPVGLWEQKVLDGEAKIADLSQRLAAAEARAVTLESKATALEAIVQEHQALQAQAREKERTDFLTSLVVETTKLQSPISAESLAQIEAVYKTDANAAKLLGKYAVDLAKAKGGGAVARKVETVNLGAGVERRGMSASAIAAHNKLFPNAPIAQEAAQ